jgi:hypothetical protein
MGALGALIVGCSEGGLPLEAGNGRTVDYAAAGANAPTSFPWFEQFDYVDPCSGLDMVVTITGTAYQRFRVHFTFVADWGTNTIRVDKGGAVCLGPSA